MEEGAKTMGETLNTGLQSSVTGEKIIAEFVKVLPWVGGLVVAAFIIYEAKRLLKGASHGKVTP